MGDIFIYDAEGQAAKPALERAAADRIFALLPEDQAKEIRALWDEFEANATPEAKYARALDRLQPLLHNYHTQGRAWKEHGVTVDRVLSLNQPILAAGAPALEEYATRLILEAAEKGYLNKETGLVRLAPSGTGRLTPPLSSRTYLRACCPRSISALLRALVP